MLSKFVFSLKMIRVYKNGSGYSFIWRWYHPLTWIVVPILFIVSCIMEGVPATFSDKHNMGMGIDPYFKKNNIPIEWVKNV